MSCKVTEIPYLRVAFLDFEASSLDRDGWPIEIGLSWINSNLQIQTYASLIRPAPDWPEHAWSPVSARIHNIPRNELKSAPDASVVSTRFLKALTGRVALSDAVPFERRWLDRLFRAAGVADRVSIEDFDGVTMSAFPSHALDHLYERLDLTRAPHRAGPDSARLAKAWLAGLSIDMKNGDR